MKDGWTPHLRIDLLKSRVPERREGFTPRYPSLIVGVIAFMVLMVALRQVSPAAALAVELGLSWLVGLGALTSFGMLWRVRELVPVRFQLAALGFTLWFLAQAGLVTYRALG